MDVNYKKKYYTDVKNVKQWFYSTKERCDSLKSHMKYMKMLYHDMPKIQETKKTLCDPNWQNCKIKTSNNDETIVSRQVNCNNSLEKYSDTLYDKIHKDKPFITSNLANILSENNLQKKEEEKEKQKNLNKQKGTETELSSITLQTYAIPQNTQSRSLLQTQKDNMAQCEEHNYNWQFPYQKHLTEYSTELIGNNETLTKSFEQLTLDNQNSYLLQESFSAKDDIKLNISGNVKDGSMDKSKVSTKNEKKEKAISSALSSKKGSLCKLDDIVPLKIKRRRKKIHCSNSRSTVTTRDTIFLGKKDTKKRKQKNSVSNRHTFKSQQTSNDVVEIYHNAAAKSGSTSAIPSKHSKLEHHMNYINILTSSAMNKQQNISIKPKYEDNNYQNVSDVNVDCPQNYSQKQHQTGQKTVGRITINNDLSNNLKISTSPACTMEKFNSHQCQHAIIQASYCDPIVTHNYEMPTLASKLKRANRSYFGRFNFQNIPFVVGTSVTPSHNLGLNIQQVLSIMKTRQIAATGVTPLLIRKISRGMKPASVLIEQINNQQSKLSHINSQMNNIHIQKENLFMSKGDHLLENENMFLKYDRKGVSNLNVNLKSNIEQYQSLQKGINSSVNKYGNFHKKKDTRSENQLNTLNTILHVTDNKMLKLFASQQNVNTKMENPEMQSKIYQNTLQGNICDKHISNTSTVNHSQDSKGIREVLINLHDQFEEMNTKYERLQAKAKKYSDKDLEEEILHLEKELSIKEDEINAVVNLYKEVMSLKHQMKLLQKKNSYVCISTEIPLGSDKLYAAMPFASTKSNGSNGSNFQQKLFHKRGNSAVTREPISLRLAGLLRQIQTFQKQLKLTSW
ncbi:uncharacterized protein isoform X1 [Bombus fervidus]|uniref:uncharacterized protein isoform X1 n=2 Tax=Bombus fervidus TaxID=203811 RepID=UPI003AB698E6